MKDLSSLIEHIKNNVSLRDMLVAKNRIRGGLSEEQFSCPFHGADRKKSARYYKHTDTAYCWVCKEKWDVISYTQKDEEMSFAQAINYLIREYRIDISKLPDAPEAEAERIKAKDVIKIDARKLSVEKLSQAIQAVREEIPAATYDKFVYTYMMLKYVVPDEKFQETYNKFKEAMLRVFSKK